MVSAVERASEGLSGSGRLFEGSRGRERGRFKPGCGRPDPGQQRWELETQRRIEIEHVSSIPAAAAERAVREDFREAIYGHMTRGAQLVRLGLLL